MSRPGFAVGTQRQGFCGDRGSMFGGAPAALDEDVDSVRVSTARASEVDLWVTNGAGNLAVIAGITPLLSSGADPKGASADVGLYRAVDRVTVIER